MSEDEKRTLERLLPLLILEPHLLSNAQIEEITENSELIRRELLRTNYHLDFIYDWILFERRAQKDLLDGKDSSQLKKPAKSKVMVPSNA